MIYNYLLSILISFILAVFITPFIKKAGLKYNITDIPGEPRKIQSQPTPLLGGLTIYFSFLIALLISLSFGWLNDGIIKTNQILAIILGGFIIVIIGFFDDKYNIRTKSFVGPFLAAILAVVLGITVTYITNPFMAGTGPYGRSLFYFSGAIGAIILFIVSLFWDVPQSGTSILALILAGSCLGFLIYNFHPAKIFLGESGSVFIGFMLGVLSIISGAKIATALLIMGIPILDVVWVILRRIFKEHKSPFAGDDKHLHFRLLQVGFSHRAAVLFLYLLTIIFGTSSLFLQSQYKVIALIILIVSMLILAASLAVMYNKKTNEKKF